jgi:predicted ester cyclase
MGSHRQLIERLFDEVWNGRQFDKIDELYAPDFVADYRPFAPLREGSDAVQGMVERAWETFPDYHEEMLAIVVEGDRAAVHLRITGTQQGAWGPLPATGRRVEFEEMILFTFGPDGRVVRQRGIADNLTALNQLGDPSNT